MFIIVYKISGDTNTYMVLDASSDEQMETLHKIKASAVLDWLRVGVIPFQLIESFGPSTPPIPLVA